MTREPDKRSDQVKHGDKRCEGAYPDKSGSQRSDTPQPDQVHTFATSSTDIGTDQEKVHVVLPDEPPSLTPEAARALLRILRKAYAQRSAPNE